MKNSLLTLIIAIIVSSCQKEDGFVLEGTYKLPETANISIVRMYTSKGANTDEATIKQFLAKIAERTRREEDTDFSRYFSFDKSSLPVAQDFHLDITFKSGKAIIDTDSGLFGYIDSPFSTDVFKQDGLIILSRRTSYLEDPTVKSITEFFETNKVYKVKSGSHLLPAAPSLGHDLPGRMNLALLEKNGQILLPRLAYLHSHYWKPGDFKYNAAMAIQVLNNDFLTRLPASDTIVVQESWAIMKKQ